MKINSNEYPVIDMVKSRLLGKDIPLLDIPMMSDERWNEIAAKQKKKSPQSSIEYIIKGFPDYNSP